MKLHYQLQQFSQSPHVEKFNHFIKIIEKDLLILGAAAPIIEIIPIEAANPNERIKWILSASDYKETGEIMRVETSFHHCSTEICIPMTKSGKALPFFMHMILPVPIYGSAEFRPTVPGGQWHVIPKNHVREDHLKNTIPPVEFGEKKLKLGIESELIKFGHALHITEDQKTEWTIHTRYEGNLITGSQRPNIKRYLEVIPKVISMLELWKQSKMDLHLEGA